MDRTQAMVQEIKKQVLAELRQDPSSHGFQAYSQLVDAVREEVLSDLKRRGNSTASNFHLIEALKQDVLEQLENQPKAQMGGAAAAVGYGRLSRAELDQIKQEVLRELQKKSETEKES